MCVFDVYLGVLLATADMAWPGPESRRILLTFRSAQITNQISWEIIENQRVLLDG